MGNLDHCLRIGHFSQRAALTGYGALARQSGAAHSSIAPLAKATVSPAPAPSVLGGVALCGLLQFAADGAIPLG